MTSSLRYAALALSIAACSPTAAPADAAPDASTDAWQHVDAWAFDAGPPERRTFVVDAITIPTTTTQVASVAVDLNADGTADNALGQLFVALAQAGVDFTTAVASNVDDGSVIMLVDARAPSFTSGSVSGYVLQGTMPMPMPCTMPTDPTTCRQHLAGTGHFSVMQPVPLLLGGSISSASMRLAGTSASIPLAMFTPPLWVPVSPIDVRADVDTNGLMHGVAAGAIRDTDVQSMVLPAMHDEIVAIVMRDCPTTTTCASGSPGAELLSVFDADDDGTITLQEVQTNGLLNSVLHPDLDLFDAMGAPGTDGTFDSLSFGFGFTAVLATFDAP